MERRIGGMGRRGGIDKTRGDVDRNTRNDDRS